MSDQDTLKLCPFCGGAPVIQHLGQDQNRGYYISCDKCEIQQIAIHTMEGAAMKWNARTALEAMDTEVARLREALEPSDRLGTILMEMLSAIKHGSIDSAEIDLNDPDVPPFKFHEEWASRARAALKDNSA